MPLKRPTIPEEDFGRLRVRLGQLRAERGFTYHDLAAEAEVSRSMLIALETGTARAKDGRRVQGSLAVWHRIASALGVPLGELIGVLDEPPTPRDR